MRLLGERAVGLTRQDLDLSEPSRIEAVLDRIDPTEVINCAAYTRVDKAEEEEDLATLINGTAVGALADWCAQRERRLLTFSTDYVFNGQATSPYVESSPPDPINAYGRSKLVGEELAVDRGALVVRSSWVISGSHPNFVATMITLAAERSVQVVNDQWGCPTVAVDLAEASWSALQKGAIGILHLTNQGPTTWYQLARAAVDLAGLDQDSLIPCSTDEYPTKAARPAYSVLDSERLKGLGLDRLPDWRDSLPAVVDEIQTWIGSS